MRFPEDTPVRPHKLATLRARIEELHIDLAEVEEKALRGSGPGGQKINKTSSTVQLRYPPLGIVVRAQNSRSRALNRFFALRMLCDAVEAKLHPERAQAEREAARLRRDNARRKRQAKVSTPWWLERDGKPREESDWDRLDAIVARVRDRLSTGVGDLEDELRILVEAGDELGMSGEVLRESARSIADTLNDRTAEELWITLDQLLEELLDPCL